jgi:hypothetical protein
LGLKEPERSVLPSSDATELVLGRAATEIYDELPSDVRHRLGDVTGVIGRLEEDAEKLRKRGDTGDRLREAVAALENVRLGLLRLRAGVGSVDDLTDHIERAQEIGERIDAELAGRREVRELLQ